MTSRRVTPLLLAASIFLTGATGAFVGSMTSAHAITSVDELTDVNQNHWAFTALQDLVEKYDVIEGYPDNTFRGERNATRWELAAALNSLIKSVGRDLARLGAEKADRSDLETLARLQEEFKNELAALQARTDALESRASAIEAKNAEQDQRLSLLERTQLHGDFSIGGLADIGANGTGGGNDGILDGISAIGRLRLTLDVPVKEDKEDSLVGAGEVHARLIGAFGRFAPSGGAGGNAGAFNPFSGYSRIATDASLNNEGLAAGDPTSYGGGLAGGGNTRTNLYIENMHYHQHFKAGIPLLTDWMMGAGTDDANWATTGDMYVGIVPWRYLFDKSPYRGNELTQFQNTAFVNTPGVAVNYNQPMIAYQWHQMLGSDDLSMDLTTGVGSINVGDVLDGLNVSYEARLNYALGALPGSLYGGGYHVWLTGNTLNGRGALGTLATTNRGGIAYPGVDTYNTDRDSTNAFYVGWNQDWYRGIGTTFNYMLSNGATTNLLYTSLNNSNLGGAYAAFANEAIAVAPRQSITGVLNIPMNVFGVREKDALGIGYGVIDLHEEGAEQTGAPIDVSTRLEHVGEIYYRWQVNDAISVIPSYQFIGNRLGVGENDWTHVIGLRTNFTF